MTDEQGSLQVEFSGFGEYKDGIIIAHPDQFLAKLSDVYNFLDFKGECLPVIFNSPEEAHLQ